MNDELVSIESTLTDYSKVNKEIGSVDYQMHQISDDIWDLEQGYQDCSEEKSAYIYLKSKRSELEDMKSKYEQAIYARFEDYYA
ncbi:hypothetical protein [Companilactobacillus nodensis]|uniref:Uncharacterized protein n=1 Tax=Companilactobacillus nodensis DSM 19682 = JCM 14932 = NBRC 107160 TaxID=1423775 RepID=A0A0R1K766_9LACO|nr:hypothetical protein [Companilactobacillus nodensis]KRK79478.1 hypothetical protein FD03_GL000608 [Companilactobacillus nodensis DSM 19682 = JCM 14932 = NBRC 107160]